MNKITRALLGAAVLLFAIPAIGQGQTLAEGRTLQSLPPIGELACDPSTSHVESGRYLRALSLDLRGTIPSEAELEQVPFGEEIPEDLLVQWLSEPEFANQVVRHHRKLLWNNVSNVNLIAASANLTRQGANGPYWRRIPAAAYRGDNVPCRDEMATFDRSGRPEVDADGREGFVMVQPYWLPDGETVKVCAFDAQATIVTSTGSDCRDRRGFNDIECGCGPELRWCAVNSISRANTSRAMGDALDKLIFALIHEGRPYTELFTSTRAFVNGPLTHFWRHQTQISPGLVFEPKPINTEVLPDSNYFEYDQWTEVQLPAEHAGILTRPGFLLRFQTNRARANQFYNAFLCSPFNPPDGGLPVANEAEARNPDLQKRAGCRYCHALLEPAAAHWGRWTEQGAGYLHAADFPETRDDCESCAMTGRGCNSECRNFYTTISYSPEEDEYLGKLNAYRFRRPDHIRHIEAGPTYLALNAIADNRLPQCVANRTVEWLLGRPPTEEEAPWIGELARQFVFSNFNYRDLVKSVVTSDVYRRVK